MSLWKKIRGEFIDIVEWLDPTQDTMVYRFERYQNEIKNGARLTVRESQIAVFINEGQIADTFGPGMYTLNTANLPILSTLRGWKQGFNSPFKAEVYFVNTKNFTNLKWGTKGPIILNDERFGMLEIRAFGTYAIRVGDPSLFIREIVGTDGEFTRDKIDGQLRSIAVTRFTNAVGNAMIPVESFAGNVNQLSEISEAALRPEFGAYGLELTKFLVENVSMPDEVKREIFELSRLEKIDLHKLAQMKAAKAMEKAAENQGAAGGSMGMGMGFMMANQMGQAFTPQPSAPQQAANTGAGGPPPLPTQVQFWAAINGSQAGPFDTAALQQMVARNELTRDTLVWKEGMAQWMAAAEVPELATLFGQVPPPLPNM